MPGLLAVLLRLLLTLGAPLEAAGTPSSAPAPVVVLSCSEIFRTTQQDKFDHLILEAAEVWKLDPFLLKGLLYEESGLQPRIINCQKKKRGKCIKSSGAAGIAQFTKTGRKGLNDIRKLRGSDEEEFTYQDSLNPEKAIPGSAELLSYLINRWGRNRGIENYNGGKNKYYFMLRVLRQTNRFRTESGLPPLPFGTPRKREPLPVS